MAVKKDNIDRMIEAIGKETKQPIFMSSFVAENSQCGTSACLAGWASLIRMDSVHTGGRWLNEFENAEKAANWMGISRVQANRLFYRFEADSLTPDQSKEAAIKLLTLVRDEADERLVQWDEVLPSELRKY
jgi:hypothetical protein